MQDTEFEIGLPIKNNNIYHLPFSCDLTKNNSAPLAINKSNVKINIGIIGEYNGKIVSVAYFVISEKPPNPGFIIRKITIRV